MEFSVVDPVLLNGLTSFLVYAAYLKLLFVNGISGSLS